MFIVNFIIIFLLFVGFSIRAEHNQFAQEVINLGSEDFIEQTVPGKSKSCLPYIYDKLSKDNRSTGIFTITGISGAGKTRLAREFIKRYHENYDYIGWINSESMESILESYVGILQDILSDEHNFQFISKRITLDKLITLLKEKLPERKKHWLLIYDNMDNIPDNILSSLPDKGGHILVTSRNQSWPNSIELTPFARTDSIRYILNTYNDNPNYFDNEAKANEIKLASQLADLLGDLPLALRQAVKYTKLNKVNLYEYIKQLINNSNDVINLIGQSQVDSFYRAVVTTTWNTTVKQLKQDHGQIIKNLIDYCAYLGTNKIPLSVFKSNHDEQVMVALRALVNHSMMWFYDGKLYMHRLIQASIRTSHSPEEKEHILLALIIRMTDILNSQLPQEIVDLYPHINIIIGYIEEDDNFAKLHAKVLAKFYATVGEASGQLGPTINDKIFFEKSLAILNKYNLADKELHVKNLFLIGSLYRKNRNFDDALATYQKALGIIEGEPHSSKVLQNFRYRINEVIGTTYRKQGKLGKALEYYNYAYQLCDKNSTTSQNLQDLLVVQSNIAGVCALMGKFDLAREIIVRVEDNVNKISLTSDNIKFSTLLIMANVGKVYSYIKDYDNSENVLEHILSLDSIIYTNDYRYNWRIFRTLLTLSRVYERKGKLDESIECSERALSSMNNIGNNGDEFSYNKMRILSQLALTYWKLGEQNYEIVFLNKSISTFKQSLQISNTLNFQDKLFEIRTKSRIARVLSQMGMSSEAKMWASDLRNLDASRIENKIIANDINTNIACINDNLHFSHLVSLN